MIKREVHNFLVNSQWIHSPCGQRRRIWKDEAIPNGWSKGMGKASKLFMERMNDRARNKKPIKWKGKIYTTREISEETGISMHMIISRLRLGWDIDRIVSTSVKQGYDEYDIALVRRMFDFWKTHTLTETKNTFLPEWKRPGKLTLPQIECMFKRYCPEYLVLRKEHSRARTEIYDGKTLEEWSNISGISSSLLRVRVHNGQDIHDAIKNKPKESGWNFRDSPETKELKRKQAAEMFKVFVEAGRGNIGLAAVNKRYGMNIGFDSLCRRFKRYGVWKDALPQKYEYNGRFYTIKELAAISGVREHTLWCRLVKFGYYGKRPMEELLLPVLPRKSKPV